MSNPLLDKLQAKRDELANTMSDITRAVADDDREDLSETETKNFEDAETKIRELDERIAHLSEIEVRNAEAAKLADKVRQANEDSPVDRSYKVVDESATYTAEGSSSFFADMVARSVDPDAAERIARHVRETRDNSTASTAGGEFVPPAYLVNDYVAKARSARPVANIVPSRPHPNVQTWYVPRITTGLDIGDQSSENSALSEGNFVTDQIQVDNVTKGGFNDQSQQALDMAQGISLDQEIFSDLARAYAVQVESMVLNSSTSNNKGLLQLSGTTHVNYEDASPTFAELYAKIGDAVTAVQENTFDSPNVIIMTPYRWNWLRTRTDSDGRFQISPIAPSNAPGLFGNNGAQGVVGELFGLPVVTTYGMPTDTESATPSDQDTVIVMNTNNVRLYESGLRTLIDPNTGSANLTVRFRLHGYVGFTAARQPLDIAEISGSGLNR